MHAARARVLAGAVPVRLFRLWMYGLLVSLSLLFVVFAATTASMMSTQRAISATLQSVDSLTTPPTCMPPGGLGLLFDSRGQWHCRCALAWTGQSCEVAPSPPPRPPQPPFPPPPLPPAQRLQTCATYSVINSQDAQINYAVCNVTLYAGYTYSIQTCYSYSGQTFLRLFSPGGVVQVAQDDNGCLSSMPSPPPPPPPSDYAASDYSHYRPPPPAMHPHGSRIITSPNMTGVFLIREGCTGASRCTATVTATIMS